MTIENLETNDLSKNASNALEIAMAELSDANLQPGVDHDAQLKFAKKTLAFCIGGGIVCLMLPAFCSNYESPENLQSYLDHYKENAQLYSNPATLPEKGLSKIFSQAVIDGQARVEAVNADWAVQKWSSWVFSPSLTDAEKAARTAAILIEEEAVYRKALAGDITPYAVLQEERGDEMKLVNIPDMQTQQGIFQKNIDRVEIELQQIGLQNLQDDEGLSYTLLFQSRSNSSSTKSKISSERELGRVLSGQTEYQWEQPPIHIRP